MPNLSKLLGSVAIAACLAGAAFAQDAKKVTADTVVATVNGYEIKASEVRMAFDDVIGQLPNLPKKPTPGLARIAA